MAPAAAGDTEEEAAAPLEGDTDLQQEMEAGAEGETVGVGVGVGVEVEVEVDEPDERAEGLSKLEGREKEEWVAKRLGGGEGVGSEEGALRGENVARNDGTARGDPVGEGLPERPGEGLDPEMPSTLKEEERSGEKEGGVLGEPDSSDEGVPGLVEAEGVDERESDAELEAEERGVNAKLDSRVAVGGGDTGRGETEGEMVGDAVVSGEGKEEGEGKVEAEVALVGPCL